MIVHNIKILRNGNEMIYLIGFLLYGIGVITGILLVIVIALNGCGDGRE